MVLAKPGDTRRRGRRRCSNCITAIARGSTPRCRSGEPRPSRLATSAPAPRAARSSARCADALASLAAAARARSSSSASRTRSRTNRRAINWTTVAWGLGPADRLRVHRAEDRRSASACSTTLGGVHHQAARVRRRRRGVRLRAARRQRRLGPGDDRRARPRGRAVRRASSPSRCCRRSSSSPRCSRSSTTSASCSSSCALFAVVMHRVMKASGAESLNVAASIFMGQTEAPLTIRPYLPEMTQSELMTVMTSGMAHISGGIMAAYIPFGIEAKHLLTAVIMTAPGTIMMAKMLVPETEVPKTMGSVQAGGGADRRQRDRRGRPRHRRRAAPGAERRRDADLVSRADRAASTRSSGTCRADGGT